MTRTWVLIADNHRGRLFERQTRGHTLVELADFVYPNDNALGGGPDNRTMPGAQPVGEVAVVIADAIEHRKREVYTHPSYPARVDGYFAGLRS